MSAILEIGMVRGLITLVLFTAFIALVVYAWSGKRRTEYDAAARIPLADQNGGA
jgi:cytochrome c oxidase cbb3-type subunit IV